MSQLFKVIDIEKKRISGYAATLAEAQKQCEDFHNIKLNFVKDDKHPLWLADGCAFQIQGYFGLEAIRLREKILADLKSGNFQSSSRIIRY